MSGNASTENGPIDWRKLRKLEFESTESGPIDQSVWRKLRKLEFDVEFSEPKDSDAQINAARFKTAEDILDSFSAIKILTNPLKEGLDVISGFRVGGAVQSESEDIPEGTYDHLFLGDVYTEKTEPYAFFKVKGSMKYDLYLRIKSAADLQRYDIALYGADDKYNPRRKRFSEEAKQALLHHTEQACYGDVLKEETKIDHNIRKGMDITLEKLIQQQLISVDRQFLQHLQRLFYLFSGIKNVTVKPYKINYYAQSDHFSTHRDSPEAGLVGTIVFHLSGDYDCMVVGSGDSQQTWIESDGPILMFYPETEHRVDPVPHERWTMTFKVVKDVTLDESLPTSNLRTLGNRIDFNSKFGILLNNGYSYIGVKSVNDLISLLKGIDLQIYNDLVPLVTRGSHVLRVVPVLVDDEEVVKTYDYISDEDGYEKISPWHSGCQKGSLNLPGHRPHYDGLRSDVADTISVHNVPEKFLEIINANIQDHAGANTPLAESDYFCSSTGRPVVYYLGSGFRFYRIDKRELYIGNEHTGWVVDQIYFNFMLEYNPV